MIPSLVIFTVFALLSGGALYGVDVRQVQEKLKTQDFYFGEPSGVMDEETSTALRRYQIRNGLAVTGELDESTAKSLGVSALSAPASTAAGVSTADPVAEADRGFLENRVVGVDQPQATPQPAVSATPRTSPSDRRQQLVTEFLAPSSYANTESAAQLEVVRWTQSQLKESGYYQAGIDGVPGDGTRRAVAAYQADHGLRPTGLLDDVTLDVMQSSNISGPVQRTFGVDIHDGRPVVRGEQVFRGVRVR